MAVEFLAPESLENLELLRGQVQAACQALGLAGPGAQLVQAAAAQAWAAVVLAGGGKPSLSLGRAGGQVRLALAYDPPAAGGAVAGLAAPLFCPPAVRAQPREQGRRRLYEIIWDTA